jgi:hypothetical protein
MTRKDLSKVSKKRPVGSSRDPVDAADLPPGKRRVLLAYPIRTKHQDFRWYHNKQDGLVVIKIKKNFGRFERALRKVAGGPEYLRIPLDKQGTRIWELCDGKHNILQIATIVYAEFKEDIEPVLPRVVKFLELLLKRNFICLQAPAEPADKKVP